MKPKTKNILIWSGIGIVVILLLSWNSLFNRASSSTAVIDPNTLAGIQTGVAPWQPEIAHLAARLSAIGLPALAEEGTVLHIHQHLDIFVHGNQVAVPADIGIASTFISPIHVHDTSGIIHVESNEVRDFTLGEFFDIWGVRLTANCIGGYCTDASDTLTVYSNGSPVSGDPQSLILNSHQEIAIVFGTASETPKTIPSNYVFPDGD